MAYTVSLSGSAEAYAYAAFDYIREVAPASAARWLTGLFAAMRTLADMPARCPVIPEAEEVGRPLRHLLYGKRTGVYRIISHSIEFSGGGPSSLPVGLKFLRVAPMLCHA
jgi:plasmid stabilization system protein ParE